MLLAKEMDEQGIHIDVAVLSLPEKDRRAVIRLVNSLVAGHTAQHG